MMLKERKHKEVFSGDAVLSNAAFGESVHVCNVLHKFFCVRRVYLCKRMTLYR